MFALHVSLLSNSVIIGFFLSVLHIDLFFVCVVRWCCLYVGRYLIESIRKFPPQKKFAGMVEEAGFGMVQYTNYIDGVVAIHSGYKM